MGKFSEISRSRVFEEIAGSIVFTYNGFEWVTSGDGQEVGMKVCGSKSFVPSTVVHNHLHDRLVHSWARNPVEELGFDTIAVKVPFVAVFVPSESNRLFLRHTF